MLKPCVLSVSVFLSACSVEKTRPDAVSPPPLVSCDISPLSPIPPIPDLIEMDEWAVTLMGLYEVAAIRLQATNDCLADLRNNGVIR